MKKVVGDSWEGNLISYSQTCVRFGESIYKIFNKNFSLKTEIGFSLLKWQFFSWIIFLYILSKENLPRRQLLSVLSEYSPTFCVDFITSLIIYENKAFHLKVLHNHGMAYAYFKKFVLLLVGLNR